MVGTGLVDLMEEGAGSWGLVAETGMGLLRAGILETPVATGLIFDMFIMKTNSFLTIHKRTKERGC